MKLVSFCCPNCNASQDVGEDSKSYTCEYCGTKIFIVKEKSAEEREAELKKRDAETRKREAEEKEESYQDLLEKVHRVLLAEENIDYLKKKINVVNEKIKDYGDTIFEEESVSNIIKLVFISLIPALIAVLSIMTGGKIETVVMLFGGSIVFGGLVFLFHKMKLKHLYKKYNKFNSEKDELQKNIDIYRKQRDIKVIPPSYRKLDAIRTICQALENKRATDISQAIQIYEDKVEKDREYNLKLKELEMNQKAFDRQAKLKEKELQLMEEENDLSRYSSTVNTVIAAGTVLSAGAKIFKTIKDHK